MRQVLLVFGLCAAALALDGKRQSTTVCDIIDDNISPLQKECAESVSDCLDGQDIDNIQNLICPATESNRENIYGALVDCRGEVSANATYAGICGTTTIDGKDVQCTEAIPTQNDGSAAKEACCGAAAGSASGGSECAEELRRLSSEVGCCAGTIVFQFLFAECVEGGLPALFMANQVDIPPLCSFPLFTGSAAGHSVGNWIFLFSIITVLLTVVV